MIVDGVDEEGAFTLEVETKPGMEVVVVVVAITIKGDCGFLCSFDGEEEVEGGNGI